MLEQVTSKIDVRSAFLNSLESPPQIVAAPFSLREIRGLGMNACSRFQLVKTYPLYRPLRSNKPYRGTGCASSSLFGAAPSLFLEDPFFRRLSCFNCRKVMLNQNVFGLNSLHPSQVMIEMSGRETMSHSHRTLTHTYAYCDAAAAAAQRAGRRS